LPHPAANFSTRHYPSSFSCSALISFPTSSSSVQSHFPLPLYSIHRQQQLTHWGRAPGGAQCGSRHAQALGRLGGLDGRGRAAVAAGGARAQARGRRGSGARRWLGAGPGAVAPGAGGVRRAAGGGARARQQVLAGRA
jgi:hypothetical protein